MRNIKLVENIRLAMLGRRVAPDNDRLRIAFIASAPVSMPDVDQHLEYRASVELGFNQIAPRGAEELVRARAARAITRAVYGEVVDELHAVREDLWQTGHGDHPAVKRLESLLRTLQGDD